jgi:ABC-2 type transport system permease protein
VTSHVSSTGWGRAGSVARNALAQLMGDRRFLAVSTVVPVVVIYLLKVFWDAIDTPLLEQSRFAVPGGVFIVHFVTYVLTAIVLVRERVAGTMERMFISGYRPAEIVAGYLGGYTLLASLQSVLILLWLNFLFDLGLGAGATAEVYAVMWLMAVVSLALGMLVSNFARNEGQVFPFIPLVMMPPVFLSGMIVPVDALPGWARLLSRVVPLRYAVDVVHEITDGSRMLSAWGPLLALPAMAVGFLLLAAATLREDL